MTPLLSFWLPLAAGALAGGLGGYLLRRRIARRELRAQQDRSDEVARRRKQEEQNALMGTIATGLAHELRNPLSTLRMNLQLLREEWQTPVTEREQRGVRKIDTLLRESERLQRILDDFLRFAAGKKLRKEPVDLNRLLDDLTEFIAPRAQKENIRFVKEFAADLPAVPADPTLLRQAVLNLLLNSEQAMPDGGTITLKTEADDARIRLRIRDSGQGIPPEIRSRVFELYFSTKPSGTGLGLPITKRILEEHGGTIQIQSEPGRGTEVVLDIPI